LSDRNIFERRIRHPQIDATRYRNRLQIEHPFKIGSVQLNGFMSDEIFYDWSVNAWVRNRVAIGVGKTFNPHFTGEIYYLRQTIVTPSRGPQCHWDDVKIQDQIGSGSSKVQRPKSKSALRFRLWTLDVGLWTCLQSSPNYCASPKIPCKTIAFTASYCDAVAIEL